MYKGSKRDNFQIVFNSHTFTLAKWIAILILTVYGNYKVLISVYEGRHRQTKDHFVKVKRWVQEGDKLRNLVFWADRVVSYSCCKFYT